MKFTAETCTLESRVGTRDLIEVAIGLPLTEWRSLAAALGEMTNREGSELRTDFPEGWTLFWKVRDGESRFFVAHPETDQWVGTIALSVEHLARIRSALSEGFSGPLAELGVLNRMSNLRITVSLKGAANG